MNGLGEQTVRPSHVPGEEFDDKVSSVSGIRGKKMVIDLVQKTSLHVQQNTVF